MPRIKYREYKPRGASVLIIERANEILQAYADQGFDLTLRQLHYQFVAQDLYPDEWVDEAYNRRLGLDPSTKNTQKNYDRLGNVISRAREGGLVDWDHIKDRGRSVSRFSHWDNPGHFVERVSRQFALDMWEDQPKRIEVWVEKDALSQVIESAADPFDVPTFATKGYASASAMWDAAHNRFLQWAQREQEVLVLHLADHDPSGVHMSDDIAERLDLFSRCYRETQFQCEVEVRRIALTMTQIQQYAPPPNPAKDSDSRKPAYVQRFDTEESWELDALDPPVLVQLIQDEIEAEMDRDAYDARRVLEATYSTQLQRLADRWEDVIDRLTEEDEE